MAKFCGNCGATLPKDANVCGCCGNPVASDASKKVTTDAGYYEPIESSDDKEAKRKSKTIIITVVSILLLVIGWALISNVCFNYKTVVKRTSQAIENKDFKKIAKLSSSIYDSENAKVLYKNLIENEIKSMNEYLEESVGKNYKLSYDIIEVDTASKEELYEYKIDLQETLSLYDIKYDVNKIKEGKILTVEFIAEKRGNVQTCEVMMLVVKEGLFSWKLVNFGY